MKHSYRLLLLASLWLAIAARGERLQGFCLTQAHDAKQDYSMVSKGSTTATLGNLVVEVDKSGSALTVRNAGDNRATTIDATQYEYGRVTSIEFVGKNWLWVDGDETDYMVPVLQSNSTLTLGKAKSIPLLSSRPCTSLRYVNDCDAEGGILSRALKRAFVFGHTPNLFGLERDTTLELLGPGNVKEVRMLTGARFVADMPLAGGVLFRGATGKPVFYDGRTVSVLNVPAGNDSSRSFWAAFQNNDQRRTFLANYAGQPKGERFLYELLPGPKLSQIQFDPVSTDTFIKFFAVEGSGKLFAMDKNSLYMEAVVDGNTRLIPIVKVATGRQLWGGENISPNAWLFQLVQPDPSKPKIEKSYLLQPRLGLAKCERSIDGGKPIVLDD